MSKIISTNPAKNYEFIGEVESSTDKEIERAVAAANKARLAWKELSPEKRIELLEPIRDEFKSRTNEIAELISKETGKPISEAINEVTRYTEVELTWFLENGMNALADVPTLNDEESLHRIIYEPHGVAAVIAPWNFPFGMAVWGIFPNLIAGNTVVFKTSEECPLTGKLIEEIILNHELPEGVFSEVYGAGGVGKILAESNINLIWFTGSTRTGKELYKIAAEKFIKVVLEMGGSNPCVVFEDANISETATATFDGRFRNSGQVCSATKRLIVHESIADELSDNLKKIMDSKTIGDPLSPETSFGTLVAERQRKLIDEQLKDALSKGAEIVCQLKVPVDLKGAYFPPTILKNITKEMRVWNEEVFGPILPVVTFKTEEEAIELANDTDYGLGARVISENIERSERIATKIDAGSIALNYEARFLPTDPFGGYKNSGMGRERGIVGLRELCQIKVVQKRAWVPKIKTDVRIKP